MTKKEKKKIKEIGNRENTFTASTLLMGFAVGILLGSFSTAANAEHETTLSASVCTQLLIDVQLATIAW